MIRVAALAAVLATAPVTDAPDFAGTWRLDEEQSRFTAEDFLPGLSGSGPPQTLLITQPTNGTLVIESHQRQSQARLYRPGGKARTPVLLGETGNIETDARWDGSRLAAEGKLVFDAGGSLATKETIGLRGDGTILAIEITITTDDRTTTSSLAYTRIDDIGPCESWPSPCKDPTPPPEP